MSSRSASRRTAPSKLPKPVPVPMAPSYAAPGLKRKLLAWSFAELRLRRAHNYWVCSTRPDGRPHAAPVWGLWLQGAFYFSTDPGSRKARNLAANPAIVVHVESGDEVVMLEGVVETLELSAQLDRAYFRKYAVHLQGFPAPMVIFRVRPAVVSAWRERAFPASATRWSFAATPTSTATPSSCRA